MKIDCHVHMVGTGVSGSGCYLNLRHPYHRLLARFMLYTLGLPSSLLKGDIETQYLSRLVAWVRESELDGLVLLAQDWVRNSHGEALETLSSLYVPNDLVLEAAKEFPEILAGVSIHPARADALDELDRCKALGAVLMKCLPLYQCIDARESRYAPFWRKMADLRLPLLVHTGGELSLPVHAPELANPQYLLPVLDHGVTVIAAHGGSSSHFFDPNYTEVIAQLAIRYPNLFVDNSGMNTPLRSQHFPALLAPSVRERVIHGSDLPIPISGFWVWLRSMIPYAAYSQIRRESNPLQRDVLIKLALGFGPESLTRLAGLVGLSKSDAALV